MKKIEPVAYMTYKGYLLHASDPKVKDHSEPSPLWDGDALQAVAEEVRNVCAAAWCEIANQEFEVDLTAIINQLKGE